MFGLNSFGRREGERTSFNPEADNTDIELANQPDIISDFAKEALSRALEVSAAENAKPGDEFVVPLPDDQIIIEAADLRTEIANLGGEKPPLCVAIIGSQAVFQCLAPLHHAGTVEPVPLSVD